MNKLSSYGPGPGRRFGRLLTLAGALLLAAPALTGCAPHVVQVAGPNAEEHQIVVIGQGEASAAPDIARANLGIEINAPTVGEATRQANERMAAIMTALKQLGVAEKDIRTSNFSVNFERQYPGPVPYYPQPMEMPGAPAMMDGGSALAPDVAPPPPVAPPKAPKAGAGKAATAKAAPAAAPAVAPSSPPRPIAPPPNGTAPVGFYRVSNTVEVTMRDLTRVGPVIDAAMAAGANNIWGVSFAIDKTDTVAARARDEAVKDARARAEALARLGGVTLGEVVSIREDLGGGAYPPPPVPMMAMAMARDSSAGASISSGELSFNMQVRVVYAIKPR
ncbi:Hypothetical protein CAP_4321 [Chondromyces apiculatus DSM 436]|uniref:DUF541 domain-containing protein n=2 Tax=Chondromyces apiculatus TaxID=51 RepID=A0A017T771_9BACT|nr:Hypothetical protein CAP_4321 [Chondromyces apiculatus DSM 436]